MAHLQYNPRVCRLLLRALTQAYQSQSSASFVLPPKHSCTVVAATPLSYTNARSAPPTPPSPFFFGPLCAMQLGADEVDVHVRSWHAWSRTPPVCQLLLHVGTRAVKQAHTQWQQGPGGAKMATVPSGEALAWDTLVGWLRELGFLFDQCAAATSEAQGRCLFFNPSQCSFQ